MEISKKKIIFFDTKPIREVFQMWQVKIELQSQFPIVFLQNIQCRKVLARPIKGKKLHQYFLLGSKKSL
jgi:hypothetical protein